MQNPGFMYNLRIDKIDPKKNFLETYHDLAIKALSQNTELKPNWVMKIRDPILILSAIIDSLTPIKYVHTIYRSVIIPFLESFPYLVEDYCWLMNNPKLELNKVHTSLSLKGFK